MLRYDAFEDVGGRLSFSCALLDEHGTGVVLTSINGRQETRVYAKPVTAGQSTYNLSAEEEEAIRQAMRTTTRKRRRHDDLATGRCGERRATERAPRSSIVSERTGTMAENGEVTIVGTGARLEGNVVSAGSLRIDGQVKGQINADGDVTLSPQSQVEADIRAQNVTVAGRFKGNIVVKDKAHLARGGRIDGNITSKTLVVEEGGVFHGQSIMDAGAASGSSSASAGSPARPRRPQGHEEGPEPGEGVR